MEHPAHFYPALAMRMRPTARRYPCPAALLAWVPPLGIILVGVTHSGASLPGQLVHPARGSRIGAAMRDGQRGGQGEPHGADGHGEGPLPPIPPAVPARRAPACCGLKRRMGDNALLPMFLVPDASARLPWRTIDRPGAARRGPGLALAHQGSPHAADAPWHMLGEGDQMLLSGAACRQTPLRSQQRTPLLGQGVSWVEKGHEGRDGRETAKTHDDASLHQQPVGIHPRVTA